MARARKGVRGDARSKGHEGTRRLKKGIDHDHGLATGRVRPTADMSMIKKSPLCTFVTVV
jgi:hypothetical protein